MISTLLLALSLASQPAPAPRTPTTASERLVPSSDCEVVGPSLGGIYYSICHGNVVATADSSVFDGPDGNVHEAPFGY